MKNIAREMLTLRETIELMKQALDLLSFIENETDKSIALARSRNLENSMLEAA